VDIESPATRLRMVPTIKQKGAVRGAHEVTKRGKISSNVDVKANAPALKKRLARRRIRRGLDGRGTNERKKSRGKMTHNEQPSLR